MSAPQLFEVYQELTIGGVSKDELLRKLEARGCVVQGLTLDLMSRPGFTLAAKETTLALARASVRALGFKKKPTTAEVLARVKEVGDLCPAEVGPQLRVVVAQPRSDLFRIAMEPIVDSDGDARLFELQRYDEGERTLRAPCPDQMPRWSRDDEWVFVLR